MKQYKINALKTDEEGGALAGAKFTVVKIMEKQKNVYQILKDIL